jgi:hypothetical protein
MTGSALHPRSAPVNPGGFGRIIAKVETRPTKYLDQDSAQWPEQVTLRFQIPAMLKQGFDDPLSAIKTEYQQRIKIAHRKAREEGKDFVGLERIKKTSPYQRATSWEDLRALNPTFAVGRRQDNAGELAIKAVKAFRRAYRLALDMWRRDDRLV